MMRVGLFCLYVGLFCLYTRVWYVYAFVSDDASLSHNCGAVCVCSVLKKAGAAQANLGKDADASLAALRDQVTRLLSIRVYRGPHRTCSAPS